MEPTNKVTVDIDGKTYSGLYLVTLGGAVVVHSDYGNAVSAGLVLHDDEEAARMLLRELVERKRR